MRIFFPIILLLAATAANAQVNLAVLAGWNNNNIHRTDNYDGTGGNNGWQAGLHATYPVKHWFIYSGAQLDKKVFYINYYYPSGPAAYTYHPLYITVPLGAGYQFGLGKQLALRLYAGVYGSVGVSGKLKITSVMCGDFTACPENLPGETVTKNIQYGKDINNDIAKTAAGLQFGAGIKAWKNFELSLMYDAGLTNVFPAGHFYGNTKLMLNTLALNAKFALFTSGSK